MIGRILIAGVLCAVFIGTSAQMLNPPHKKYLYNPTPSAPIGWYKIDHSQSIKLGSFVAFYAPEKAVELAVTRHYLPSNIPLLKTVWAIGGMEVCAQNGQIVVTDRPVITVLTHDSLGREMPMLNGCFTLKPDEVFLISERIQGSFDSRYFGVVQTKNVLGVAVYLGGDPE